MKYGLGLRWMHLPSHVQNIPHVNSTSNCISSSKQKKAFKHYQKVNTSSGPVSVPLLKKTHPCGSNSSFQRRFSYGKGINNAINSNSHSKHDLSLQTVDSLHKHQYTRQQLQQRSAASFYPHPTDEKQARFYAIPRNFSRIEAARFPHSYQHRRQYLDSTYKKYPLTHKMPNKRVGRFFLVFPFSETTHQLSQHKLDSKAVIKEIQKNLRENLKTTSSLCSQLGDEDLGGEKGVEGYIWAPLKCSDSYNY